MLAKGSDHKTSAGRSKTSNKKSNTPAKATVKRLKLKNGLSILLLENHKAPVVTVQMWVKTGSADEKKGEEGISHFIEHLVFKGTDKYGVGEIASIVEASGGELNAYTSFDQTVFYVNISREFSDVALDVISEMMGFPKFDSDEIDNEREVVLEEIKRSNDSPGRQASRMLFSTVFKDHPYGIPVIGYDRIIRKVSRKTLVNYYQSRYIPTNMHLVVAGDFDSKEMAKKLNESFGRLKSFKLRKVTRKPEPKQATPRLKVMKAAFEEAQFHMAWRIPGASHKDIAALDVLALILGQGDSSRLAQKLRLQAPLTNSIGAGTFTPKDGGLFTVSGSLNVDQTKAVFEGLKEELLKMVAEPPSEEELKKAIVNLESEEFYSMETIEGVARKAGSFENLMGDYAYFQKFLKQIYALKPADIQRAAKKYLDAASMNLVMMVPRNEKDIEKSLRQWIKTYQKEVKATRPKKTVSKKKMTVKKVKWQLGGAATSTGAIEKHTLSSGASIFFRQSQATPVFSAKAALLGGLRIEDPKHTGLTELLSRVWTSGTKNMSEVEISSRIENIAGGISAFGGRNSAGLSMQSISPFEDEAISLFSEILTEPVISDSVTEREKVIMLESIRSKEDSPAQLASQLFTETMFAGHPYALDLYGTRETVTSLTADQATKHYKKMAQAKNLTLVLTGDVDKSKWIDSLERATSKWPKGQALSTNFPYKGPSESIAKFKKLDREQTHIIIGYKGLTLTDPKRYTLQVMQSILAGQGGRLFLELRDKASLAYSVAPMRMEGIEAGYFGAYIGCSPGKGEKAIEMLRVEFAKLVDKLVPQQELERAKRYLIGRHDIDLQRNSSIAATIIFNEIYGISSDEVFRYAEHLRDIRAEDIRELAKSIFSQPNVLCAVGPNQPW